MYAYMIKKLFFFYISGFPVDKNGSWWEKKCYHKNFYWYVICLSANTGMLQRENIVISNKYKNNHYDTWVCTKRNIHVHIHGI